MRKKKSFEIGEVIVDNVGAVDSFSDSLKKIVVLPIDPTEKV